MQQVTYKELSDEADKLQTLAEANDFMAKLAAVECSFDDGVDLGYLGCCVERRFPEVRIPWRNTVEEHQAVAKAWRDQHGPIELKEDDNA
jgi:hypothetical protein